MISMTISMAYGRRSAFSANLCLVITLYLLLDNRNSRYSFNNIHGIHTSDLFLVSESNCRIEITNSFTRSSKRLEADNTLNLQQKSFLFCKLLHRASLALILVALSGDVEPNPGFLTFEDIKTTRGLKIAHLNIRSLRKKTDAIRLEGVNNNTIDVLTLSETWLDDSTTDAEITLPGFSEPLRLDRKGVKEGYGGVAVYIREGLPFRERKDINNGGHECHECLWIELIRNKCKPTIICCAYRAPDTDFNTFISSLQNSLAAVEMEKSDLVILGDFNVNMLPNSKGSTKDKQELFNFSRAFDLKQLINEPTRITDTSRTLIDLIFVNNKDRFVKSGVVPVPLSDHFLVFCILKTGVWQKVPPRIIEYRSFKNFDANKFNSDLKNVPWHVVENEDNVDDALTIWNKLFLEVADEHAPIKRRRFKGRPIPWMSSEISELMQKRDQWHRKAIKTNTSRHWIAYKKTRNAVNRLVKSAKRKYYCDLIEQANGNSKEVWKAVNEVSSRRCSPTNIECIISDGVQQTTPKSIATAMNDFFVSVGRRLAESITIIFPNHPSNSNPPDTSFTLTELDESSVLKQLLSLKTNKAIGLDKVSARLIKNGAHVIAPSITKILNFSIRSQKFPELWKCSKITPLHKAGDRTNTSNYRPISILPTLSKILEKAVHDQLYEYVNTNNLLTNKQFGFRKRNSTTSALTAFADEVLLNMEQGRFCGAVFLDLTKAFDTVDHSILINKLSAIGVSQTSIDWFYSYLTNRKQRTCCKNELSNEQLITHGVPQGSILGPLLFIIYINDLPQTLKFSCTSLYADDTVLYCFSTNRNELTQKLNDDLFSVAKWLNEHKLTLNLEKTKCMLIGSSRKPDSKLGLNVSIFNHDISNVLSFKYLGVSILSDFTWAYHIENIATKINQRLSLLRRIKQFLPYKSRLLFYNSLVLPLFDYADIVWGDKHNTTLMHNLQILQNKAAKIILDRPFYASSTEALADLKWITLEKRRFMRRCLYIFKCLNGLADNHMNLKMHQDKHMYNTRNKNRLIVPMTKRNWGQQRTCFHAVKDYNSLCNDIVSSKNIHTFKQKIFNILT